MEAVSPKLKVVVKEIEAVLRKHDVGGLVVLSDGDSHAEWRLFFDTPTWSTLRFVGDKGIHIKAHAKSKPVETGRTVNMLWVSHDVIARCFMMIDQMKTRLRDLMDIEEGEGTWAEGP